MTTTDTYRLLRALCDELARCGLRHACTSPGSRNTPILLSLVREPQIRCWSHLDERCAGFFAVGAAKASGTPVAMTCTSGTAAANFVPAVVEAYWARVPLIVLTADRPAELRDVGAGQAIDQLKLYGDAVKWFSEVELPPEADEGAMRWIRQLACRAYWTAAEGRPGPVHLNLPLREPLILEHPLEAEIQPGRPDGRPWVGRSGPGSKAQPWVGRSGPGSKAQPWVGRSGPGCNPRPVARSLPARGVIVAGRDEGGLGVHAAATAERLGYPLLADPLSGARHGVTAIATYDLLLREPDVSWRPDVVIRIGDLPTSKPLRAWLASLGDDVPQLALDPHGAWQDPDAVASEIWGGDPAAGLDALTATRHPDWLSAWLRADEAASGALEEALGVGLSEPLVAGRLGDWLPAEATLFVAASMPIRDVELYLAARRPLPRVLSNRGANGIDGTVSAAFGVAAASDRRHPVTLLIGDVALAHDIGGLLAARRLGLELTVVLLNNDGGGIFHFLPVSGEGDPFEEHVATPHALDFAQVAAVYGFAYDRAGSPEDLRAALQHSGGCRLIEVRTNRAQNLALHRRAAAAALAAVRA
jgi:2-succinyl-5-enolpyruvyl-6-hydroxy-3-cyclohexene-1-carboxylate synthase